MPRTPTIFFNNDEWEKLEKRVEAEGCPSKYAYIKDLILKDLKNAEKSC